MQVFGVILAGGQGRRMGGVDKHALTLGGVSLLERAVALLSPQVAELAISANTLAAARWPILHDEVPDMGPLAGILAAMGWAGDAGATHVVSVAVDTPFFPGDLVPRLLLAAQQGGHPVALAASGGRTHPVFGLWPVDLRDVLRSDLAAGTRRLGQWADTQGAARAAFDTAPIDPFLNINTPDDMAVAQGLLD